MKRLLKILSLLLVLFSIFILNQPFALAEKESKEEKWKGFDEAVLEKLAKEHGREPKEGFITLEGDLELFMFSLMSGISGFVVGYYFRKIFVEGSHAFSHRKEGQPSS
jgi:ABC-type cobalt transport system substrate-binding protein